MRINNNEIYVIAEMASAHQGSIKKVYQLIDSAIDCKANCIQVQIFNLNANASVRSKNYEVLKKLEISLSDWSKVLNYLEKKNIDYSVFTYDEPSLEFVLENYKPNLIKFNSSEISNPNMLNLIAKSKNIPLNLGTGGSTILEIERAVKFLNKNKFNNIFLAHGLQNFPTEIKNINFPKLKQIMKLFEYETIFCDHTDFRSVNHQFIDYVALGLGVKIFEKHFILENNSKYIDNESSLNVKNFKSYIENLRLVSQSLITNSSIKISERNYRKFQKKSTFINKDLPENHILTIQDVEFKRDVGNIEGIDPLNFMENFIGKLTSRKIKKRSKLKIKDIK